MKLRTCVDIKPSKAKLGYDRPILLLGSCFTEHIGKRFERLKFDVSCNSHGVLYSVAALEQAVTDIIDKREYSAAELSEHQGLFFSWNHHGNFSSHREDLCLRNINSSIEMANKKLSHCSHFILSLGTAFEFRLLEKNQVVANCHKLPSLCFKRELNNYVQLCAQIESTINKLLSINNYMQIVLTVSPVRHLRDGLENNQLSKSILRAACYESCQISDRVSYFPSYEIMVDELRDYRFYSADMSHITEQAADYIWQQFQSANFSEKAFELSKQVKALIDQFEHRPLHENSAAHRKSREVLLEKLNSFQQKNQLVDLSYEIKALSDEVKN